MFFFITVPTSMHLDVPSAVPTSICNVPSALFTRFQRNLLVAAIQHVTVTNTGHGVYQRNEGNEGHYSDCGRDAPSISMPICTGRGA